MNEWRYVEQFASVDPLRPFRILPVGKYSRFGRKTQVTAEMIREMAANFGSVPETALPINPDHKSEMGKLGSIKSVEARADGLYMLPDWTDEGMQSVQSGKFQYFSPEIIWGPTDYEGKQVSNVLMGVALTNSPYFGKETALYTLDDSTQEYREFTPEMRRMMADKGMAMPDGSFPIQTVEDLKNAVSAWGRSPDEPTKRHIIKRARALGRTDLLPSDWQGSTQEDKQMENNAVAEALKGVLESFGIKPQQPPAPVAVTETEEYRAVVADKQKLEDQLKEQEKAQKKTANIEKFSAALKVEKFETPKGLAEKFAAVAETDEKLADELVTEYKALVEQARVGKLFAEIGSNQGGADGATDAEKFTLAIDARMKEKGIKKVDALKEIAAEQPQLYDAYRKASLKRSGDDK